MSDDAGSAFAPLEERADAAVPGQDVADRISVRDHVVEVDIGAFQTERGELQRVRFSVVVEVAPSTGAETDDVDDILSYDTITEAIAHELAAERLNLLETLAERIAARILTEPQSQRVFVRVEKLDRGPGQLGVEIVRSREEAAPLVEEEPPHPLVVFLDNEAIESFALSSGLDHLAEGDHPVILCVGMGETPAPRTNHPPTQRRVNLLAIEQNAWRLGARDDRCVVVGTRTELDWGMKNGQISVWAPSKLVLDAVDGPSGTDPVILATWFAQEMNAARLVLVGVKAEGVETRKLEELP